MNPQDFTTELLQKKARLYAEVLHIDEQDEADHAAQEGTAYRSTNPAAVEYHKIMAEVYRRRSTTYDDFKDKADRIDATVRYYLERDNENAAEQWHNMAERLHMQHPEHSTRYNQEHQEQEARYQQEREEEERARIAWLDQQ